VVADRRGRLLGRSRREDGVLQLSVAGAMLEAERLVVLEDRLEGRCVVGRDDGDPRQERLGTVERPIRRAGRLTRLLL
jgi:hypothetical protein